MEKSILIISSMFSTRDTYGGVCKEFAIKLAQNDWQVITTSALPNRYLRSLDMLLVVWRKRRSYTVAQVDVFSGPAFRWAEASAKLLRMIQKPYVLTLRGGNLPKFSQQHPERVQALLKPAAAVTTLTPYLSEAMRSYRNNIKIIPNPIDINLYSFRLRSKPEPKLLYLRSLHKGYNPSLAVYTLSELIKICPSAKLTIAGPDKGDGTYQEVQKAIDTTDLRNHIDVVGQIPKADVPQIMKQFDIFINTTNVDNTPISIIEAMATGMCIVSTDVGGIPHLLRHETDALLVPPNDPQAMAKAVNRILVEPDLAAQLSHNSRRRAEQFDWAVALPQWEQLLLRIAHRETDIKLQSQST